jgi:hypothetical protein
MYKINCIPTSVYTSAIFGSNKYSKTSNPVQTRNIQYQQIYLLDLLWEKVPFVGRHRELEMGLDGLHVLARTPPSSLTLCVVHS